MKREVCSNYGMGISLRQNNRLNEHFMDKYNLHKLNNAIGLCKWSQFWVMDLLWIQYIHMAQTWEETTAILLIK